ncbi:ATP-binding protein [Streptomyces sp. NBC_01483]|uniref:ATP-binding protein n=1 Tax=Streptomyces sp. NBC_01483 TaxID=2903883 RepID=UPI002E353F5A|nr:hypothetical protein [Streptomyces sp. NBC_01483]
MDETSGADGGAASLLEASLALDSDGSRIAQARHLASAFLTTARDDHGIPVVTATVEIVQLIVSELVANARKYAPGPALLRLRLTGAVVRVDLWDSNPVVPAAKPHDPNAWASTAWRSSEHLPRASLSSGHSSASASPRTSPAPRPPHNRTGLGS